MRHGPACTFFDAWQSRECKRVCKHSRACKLTCKPRSSCSLGPTQDFGPATFNHSLLEKKGLLHMLFQEFDRRSRGYISQRDLEAVGVWAQEKKKERCYFLDCAL